MIADEICRDVIFIHNPSSLQETFTHRHFFSKSCGGVCKQPVTSSASFPSDARPVFLPLHMVVIAVTQGKTRSFVSETVMEWMWFLSTGTAQTV